MSSLSKNIYALLLVNFKEEKLAISEPQENCWGWELGKGYLVAVVNIVGETVRKGRAGMALASRGPQSPRCLSEAGSFRQAAGRSGQTALFSFTHTLFQRNAVQASSQTKRIWTEEGFVSGMFRNSPNSQLAQFSLSKNILMFYNKLQKGEFCPQQNKQKIIGS